MPLSNVNSTRRHVSARPGDRTVALEWHHGPLPDMPRPGAAAQDVPRLRQAVLPHRSGTLGYRVLFAEVRGTGPQAEAEAAGGEGGRMAMTEGREPVGFWRTWTTEAWRLNRLAAAALWISVTGVSVSLAAIFLVLS